MMRRAFTKLSCLAALFAASACATTPTGPMVNVMPGPYKPFDVFVQDQQACKSYAYSQVAGQAEAANNRGVGAAVIGTVAGAALGAAIGGDGRGAGIGAAYGAVAGTAVGASNSNESGWSIQRRYDIAYEQCMYAKGNQVPGFAAPQAPASLPPPPPPPRG